MNATPQNPDKSKSRFTKMLAGGLIAVTAVGGAAAFVPTIASAQEVEADAGQDTEDEGRGGRHGNRGAKFEAIAESLDMTVEELKAARQDGQSLAEIAGDDVDALIQTIVDAKTERIEAAVESGRITQEQADEKLAGLADKVTEKVNAEPGERGQRGFGRLRIGGGDTADA